MGQASAEHDWHQYTATQNNPSQSSQVNKTLVRTILIPGLFSAVTKSLKYEINMNLNRQNRKLLTCSSIVKSEPSSTMILQTIIFLFGFEVCDDWVAFLEEDLLLRRLKNLSISDDNTTFDKNHKS